MKIKSISIGKRKIGNNEPCYIIAEIGSYFEMNLMKAKKIIILAKKSGAGCVKFQSFVTEKLLSQRGFEKKATFQKKWKQSVWQVYKYGELPREWHE